MLFKSLLCNSNFVQLICSKVVVQVGFVQATWNQSVVGVNRQCARAYPLRVASFVPLPEFRVCQSGNSPAALMIGSCRLTAECGPHSPKLPFLLWASLPPSLLPSLLPSLPPSLPLFSSVSPIAARGRLEKKRRPRPQVPSCAHQNYRRKPPSLWPPSTSRLQNPERN